MLHKAQFRDNPIILIKELYDAHGYDFRSYSEVYLQRRINDWMVKENLTSTFYALKLLRQNNKIALSLVKYLTIGVTQMFRDPSFFVSFKKNIIPLISNLSQINIWCAGCSTGEEAYSFAILLKEAGLLDKSNIYATDLNATFLQTAKRGVYSIRDIKKYTQNYIAAKGENAFSEYYKSYYDAIIMDKLLRDKIIWLKHNLLLDNGFARMHVIICRNVLIYFNDIMQNKSLQLFKDNLNKNGVLCIGLSESIMFSSVHASFSAVDRTKCIYKLNV